MKYYAHTLEGQPEEKWQLLKDHLISVADLASKFAEKFKGKDIAYMTGLLHDIGKYSCEFQEKLRGRTRNFVNHSTAGAREVIKKYGNLIGKMMAYSIAGHHCGLADYTGTGDDSCLEYRLNNDCISDYSNNISELKDLIKDKISFPELNATQKNEIDFSGYFLIKMFYSCLVDADFLDTEKFCDPEKYKKRIVKYSFEQLKERIDNYYENLKKEREETELNKVRDNILENCLKKAENNPGFFTLTVPTGGGKTLSSLSFALNHAIKNNLERIIYVIPYTSIIEQNADVFRMILGNEYVLEHHSNYEYKKDFSDEEDLEYKLHLATENWDMPVIVTTNVQFFESLFSNRSSRLRKLHNIIKSVIILDEAQMLPVEFMKPCLYSLAELIKNYSCTIIFCTATQPALFESPPQKLKLPTGLNPIEIIDEPKKLYKKLKAVNVKYIGNIKIDKLKEEISKYEKVLCIVNTRRLARELYENLKKECRDDIYHLSAAMCAAHRSEKIAEIKIRLKNNKKCKVISTQLIEAGVDIDFPVVFREIAGIDSIAQAAGRCNRERKIKNNGTVYVFKIENYRIPPGFLSKTAGVASEVINSNKSKEILDLEGIKEYFEILYSRERGLDEKNIVQNILNSGGKLEYSFKTIADSFKIIDDFTYSVIVPYNNECEKILKKIEFSLYPTSYIRELQRYTVQIYKQNFNKLIEMKKISNIKDIFFVIDKSEYSNEIGIILNKEETNKDVEYIV